MLPISLSYNLKLILDLASVYNLSIIRINKINYI